MAGNATSGMSFDKFRQELDSLLESAWSNGEKALDKFGLRSAPGIFEPRVDVIETPENVIVAAEVPGIEPTSVDVSLMGNMLTLTGERTPIVVAEGDRRHIRELTCGKFVRAVPLPAAVDPDKVSASAKNGVLTIHLAKQQVAKPHQIPVSVG